MHTTLADWLDYQQRVHPRAIALGLERVGAVWRRLGAPAPAPIVVTVAGTNGKGSTIAFLDAILAAQGKRVGAFTSPHLLRYNERVRVAGHEVADATLVEAFERIECARDGIALTYFEYGTLAAIWIFAHAALDIALLEVGLGGRLDAVNLIDADAAVVTTVDLDHQDWLGADRDSIGREKAGVFRAARPAIVGESDPPASLIAEATRIGADLIAAGRDFSSVRDGDVWRWSSGEIELALPLPGLVAPCQLANAAAAIAALRALRRRIGWDTRAIARGVRDANIGARLQRFQGEPELVVDVAHNPQAARALAEWLRETPTRGRTFAVFGALADKDVDGILAALGATIDAWFLAGLERDSPRGLDADALLARFAATSAGPVPVGAHADVAAALAAACAAAGAGDRVLAFGSFFVAGHAIEFAGRRALRR